MRRAIYEWSGIACVFLGLGCLVFWILSYANAVPLLELGFPGVQFQANHTRALICDHPTNLEVIELVRRKAPFEPPPTRILDWGFSWLHFDYLGFENGSPIWALQVSLWIPIVLFPLFSFACFRRCLQLQRSSSQSPSQVAAPAPGETRIDFPETA